MNFFQYILYVYFNNEIIPIKTFKDYCNLYDFKGELLFHKFNENLEIGMANSNCYQQVSLVNGISTKRGGKYINFVCDQLELNINKILKSDNNGNLLK
jgi:DNA topoisomerase-2